MTKNVMSPPTQCRTQTIPRLGIFTKMQTIWKKRLVLKQGPDGSLETSIDINQIKKD